MSEKILLPKLQKFLATHPFQEAIIAGVISGIVVVGLQELIKYFFTCRQP